MRVVFDFKPAYVFFDDIQRRQIPYAHSLALTNTAMYARRAVLAEFKRQFDRPKPSTLNEKSGPLRVKTASVSKYPNDYSEIRVKDVGSSASDPAIVYLSHHIHGRRRVEKRSEIKLRAAGILPAGAFAIPGEGAIYDQYGNMSRKQMEAILKAVGAKANTLTNTKGRTLRATYRAQRRAAASQAEYFVAYKHINATKHLAEGVWQKIPGSAQPLRPVLMFIRRAPKYRKRIRWEQLATEVGRYRFPLEMHIAMRQAIATAKYPPASFSEGFSRAASARLKPTLRALDRARVAR